MFLFLQFFKNLKHKTRYLNNSKLPILFLLLTFSFIFYVYIGTNRSFVDSIYYTSMIMTTVGFGDITPSTDLEKIMIVMFMGIGITGLGYLIGSITEKVNKIASLKLKGLKKMKKKVSLLIIGYPSEQKVKEIVEHIKNDDREEETIVCLNNVLDEKPNWMDEMDVTFIKGLASDRKVLQMANAKDTEKCLILSNKPNDITSDDYTSSSLTVFSKLNNNKAKVFVEVVRNDQTLFEDYDKNIVTTFRVENAEVISQEILDPGAFQLKDSAFSTKTKGTQFNIDIEFESDVPWSKLAFFFITENTIPEGFKESSEITFNLLPKHDEILKGKTKYTIKYRGENRINLVNIKKVII